MRISWGVKIIIVFIVFAGGIGTLVGISMSKNIDLVSENYYEKELKYQDRINMINRANLLTEKIIIKNNPGNVRFEFPYKENITGNINFYRAMDKKKDFTVNIDIDKSGIQTIPTDKTDKGNWKIEVIWIMEGKEYFIQTDIFIN
jgi:hypothetical protein